MNNDFKEKFLKIFSLRRLFMWGNLILLVLFLIAAIKDQNNGWAKYQKQYKKMEVSRLTKKVADATSDAEKIAASEELKLAKKMPIEIRQLWVQDINAIDRCITCHVGFDPLQNTTLSTPYKEHPFYAPEGSVGYDIHKAHNLEKFGCVVCHGGQGLATEVKDAHGPVEHWETPLLTGTLLQASCEKCHDNLSEIKIKNNVYASDVIRGKQLFKESGCIGCHQIHGEGGPISVDLAEETAIKPLSRIDFGYTGFSQDEKTLANWIRIHLAKDPVSFVPGDPEGKYNTEPIAPSAMPPYLFSEKDVEALTAYILGLNRQNLPNAYLVTRPAEKEPTFSNVVQHGQYVYEKYGCNACHGYDARGGVRNYNYQYGVTPNLRRVVGTYTREELKDKISNGVPIVAKHNPDGPLPPLYMPAWKTKIKGAELEDLVTYLQSIKE